MTWSKPIESTVEDEEESSVGAVKSAVSEGSMELKPSALIAQAASMCITAPDDRSFIRAVTRLKSVLNMLSRKKLKKLEELKENMDYLDAMLKDIPPSFQETPDDWKAYVRAEYQFNLVMQAVYDASIQETSGTI